MNLIKIAITLKQKISEFYDIKHYNKQSSEQFIVRNYSINNQKIIVDKEK